MYMNAGIFFKRENENFRHGAKNILHTYPMIIPEYLINIYGIFVE